MEDSLGSIEEGGGGSEITGSKEFLRPCLLISCNEPSDLVMCSHHLESPERDNFEIMEGVDIKPSKAPVTRSKKIKLVNALMAISHKKLMHRDGGKYKRYIKALNKAMKANHGNMEVIELVKGDDGDHSDYYCDSKLSEDGHRSSENCRSFRPSEKTQIVIDKVTREIIFCLPARGGWSLMDQESFKNCLIRMLKYQPNFLNKNAKKRRTTASKWAMIGRNQGAASKEIESPSILIFWFHGGNSDFYTPPSVKCSDIFRA